MKFIVIQDQSEWDSFVMNQPGSQFLQSWNWGEFKRSQGQKVIRCAYEDESGVRLVAAQFIFHPKKLFGGFWFAPRGPIITHDLMDAPEKLLSGFLSEAEQELAVEKAMFVRCEPPIEYKIDATPLPAQFVRRRSINPSSTVIIDLKEGEEELLADMHEKSRYNIRLAERKGVTVRIGDTDKDIESYLALNRETAARDQFSSQSDAYIRSTVKFLRKSGMARIRSAEYEGKTLAANIEIRFGDTLTYLYGASSSAHRNVMAPYALQWSAIKAAKNEGCRFYDLYGANPSLPSSPDYKKSWEGITRFKLGLGGSRVEYAGTWEKPLMPLVYRLMRMVRG